MFTTLFSFWNKDFFEKNKSPRRTFPVFFRHKQFARHKAGSIGSKSSGNNNSRIINSSNKTNIPPEIKPATKALTIKKAKSIYNNLQ